MQFTDSERLCVVIYKLGSFREPTPTQFLHNSYSFPPHRLINTSVHSCDINKPGLTFLFYIYFLVFFLFYIFFPFPSFLSPIFSFSPFLSLLFLFPFFYILSSYFLFLFYFLYLYFFTCCINTDYALQKFLGRTLLCHVMLPFKLNE